MEQLKQRIYWMCDELRRLQQLGVEGSDYYNHLLDEVNKLQQKYDKAKEFFDDYMLKCSKEGYLYPKKGK